MARVRVMYWKEIPVQVQALDGNGPVSVSLDPRFQHGVDAIAMFDGSTGTDAYLAAWEWGPYTEVPGTAKEAAGLSARRYNSSFPQDFVARVREMHRSGTRSALPGSADNWMDTAVT